MKINPFPIETLRFEHITYSHENHEPILAQTDFEFPMNDVVWIKSPEGSGKSTLLQILAGLVTPQHGKYLINNQNVLEMSFEEFLPYRLSIGYSFDYAGLINNRTVFENLILPLEYHKILSGKEARQRVDSIIKRFEISKYKDERPAHVPGRVRKLTCLLRSLILFPQLLLMDDASVGLGIENTEMLVELILDLRKNQNLRHVFFTSYDEQFMNRFEHKVIHIDQAQIYYSEPIFEKKVANI